MKTKIIRILFLIATLTTSWQGLAQMPYVDTAWVRESPVVGPGIYHTSTIVSSGKLVVTGNVVNVNGDTDVITTKYNTNGTVNWSMTYSGNFTGGGDDYGIELKEQGSYIWVIGAVKNNSTGYDWIVLKYLSSNGTLSTSYTFNGVGNGDDIPSSLYVETSGAYICGGSQASNGLSDYAVVKYPIGPGSGWTKYYDYNNLHDGATAIVSSGTNVVVTGASAATVGDWDVATLTIHKLAGTMTSARTNITGATMVEGRAMATDSLNNIYITGYATVGGDKDIQTIKLDSTLALKWIANYEDSDDDVGNDIAVDSDGNVYVTGYNEQPDGRFKAITIKYDDNGDTLWTERSVNDESGLGAKSQKIAINSNDEVFITGINISDITSAFFFSQYTSDGELLLSAEHESDAIDSEAYDIVIDADTVYVTGLSNPITPTMTSIKYVLLEEVSTEYFYLGGKKIFWCQQSGMYAFSKTDSTEMTGLVDSTIVVGMEYTLDGNHYVYFSPDASEVEIDSIINLIEGDADFDKEYMVAVLTSNNSKPYTENLYAGLDNFVEVVFDDAYMDITDIETFGDNYSMTLFHAPPSNIKGGVYIFQAPRSSDPNLTINLSAEIWENDSNIVKLVNPSLRVARPHNPYDPYYSGQWWAENDGEGACNSEPWVTDSDIDLDKAWNLDNEFGYGVSWSGLGINVGVIDYHGFEYDHPDLTDVFETGYYLPAGTITGGIPFTMTTITDYESSHGQCVSGLIAANLGDSVGIAGTAYNANIIPGLMISGTTAAIISGIQVMSDDSKNVSVINMSFGYSTTIISLPDFYAIATAVQNAYTQGRDSLGIVMVASTGNHHVASTGYATQVPACYNDWVLSVGATTPDDKRKSLGDAYDPGWGSVTFSGIDVCAPGICMYSTDFQGADGYDDASDYYVFGGTSAAAPVASGVAALILEKNSSLTAEEVYNNMRWSCEKVGGYSYSYGGAPQGTCYELGYGRLNAFAALGYTPFLEVPTEEVGIEFYFNNPTNELLQLTVNGIENYTITIVSITGAICYERIVNSQHYSEINVGDFAEGLYFIKITDNKNNITSTSKLVIQ